MIHRSELHESCEPLLIDCLFTFIYFSIAGPSITATPERESSRFYLVQNGWEAQSSSARSWDSRSDILRCCFSALWKCLCLAAFDVADLHGNSMPIARLSSHWQISLRKLWISIGNCVLVAQHRLMLLYQSSWSVSRAAMWGKWSSQRRWINSRPALLEWYGHDRSRIPISGAASHHPFAIVLAVPQLKSLIHFERWWKALTIPGALEFIHRS